MACVKFRRNRRVVDFYDQDGIRRWKTLPKGTTKHQANEQLGKIEKQVGQQTYRGPEERAKPAPSPNPTMKPLLQPPTDEHREDRRRRGNLPSPDLIGLSLPLPSTFFPIFAKKS